MLKLIRFIRGYVVFKVIGRFPERFLNLCMHRGRFLFNVSPTGGEFTAAMLIKDYKAIRPLARRSVVRLRIKEKHGVPFIIRRYSSRVGLLIGLLIFLLIAQFVKSFVWTVEVHGLEQVSESYIIEKLNAGGLREGAFKGSLNLPALERSLMEGTEEIGWMSINIIGTKAEVEIKEKEVKPDIPDFAAPCNIKAQRDGVILKMNIRKGKAAASVGSAVMEGQLLVSSVVDNALEEISFVRADGEVIAETHREMSLTAQSKGSCLVYGETEVRKSLIFLWAKIPTTFSTVRGEYTSYPITEKLFINDTAIELGTVTELCVPFENKEYNLSSESLRSRLNSEELLYRFFALGECEAIETSKSFEKTPKGLRLSAKYTCIEDIAKREELVVN